MAKFKTTKGIASTIDDIIRQADDRIILVSPYLQISDHFAGRLREADDRGVQIDLIYRDENLNDKHEEMLGQLKNLRLHVLESLHAKCYLSEKKLLIASMNLYEYSEHNNREMGVAAAHDESIYEDAAREVRSLLTRAEPQPLTSNRSSGGDGVLSSILGYETSDTTSSTNGTGHCIRCDEHIALDTDKPYCRSCFKSWAKYENPEYEENYCHSCGDREPTSLAKPQCYACYKARAN